MEKYIFDRSNGLCRCLLPDIQAFYESEEGQREFAEWKAKQEAVSDTKVNKTNKYTKGRTRIIKWTL